MNKSALDNSLNYLDSWLAFRHSREDIPGISLAVSYKSRLIFNSAYGYADLASKTKLTSDHLFRIASHSKTFTATSIMQLQEKGKLRIDDRIADYLPWLKNHSDKRWTNVTIRQLMSHSAGVIRDGLHADYWQLMRPFPDENELKSEILTAKLVLDNNVRLKYSNFGYNLLGLLIEAVSKQDYEGYATKNIIQPLGLNNTGADYNPSARNRLATGYSRADVDRTRQPLASAETKTNAMAAATGYYSNAENLCRYFSAHFVGSKKLLSDESKKEMQRVQFHAENLSYGRHEDYGLGFEINYPNERRTFGHGGGFPGFTTQSSADPNEQLVVVVLTNCNGGAAELINDAVFTILDYFQKNTPATKPKHDLAKLAGRYFDLFSIADIVVTGDKIIASYPDSWWPLSTPEELEYIDNTTLKVGKTNSFASEGELVRFNLDKAKLNTINYAGSTMWPEKAWLKKQARK